MRTAIIPAILCSLAAILSLADPAAAQEPREFCPDRPGLGTPACTIGSGRVAIELGLLSWTLDRQGADRADEFSLGDLLVRYGVTDSLEVQVGWAAFGRLRERTGGTVDRTSGTGDLLVALRRNLRQPRRLGPRRRGDALCDAARRQRRQRGWRLGCRDARANQL